MKNETATSSKAAMAELLGTDGTGGAVKTQFKEMTTAITALANATAQTIGDRDAAVAKIEEVRTAIAAANTAIDDKLDSGDLTQLDTSNLKALKSSINDIQTLFETTVKGLKDKEGQNNNLDLDALKKAFTPVLESNKELGKKVLGTVGIELEKITDALTGADGIKSIVDTAVTTAQGAQGNQAALDVKDKYNALKTAITAATDAIDEKLELGDLTQLDTANLKALKSSINDIQSQLEVAFANLNVDPTNTTANVPVETAKKLKETLEGGAIKSNTELGQKAGKVVTSSQNETATSSKAAMEKALETDGVIENLNDNTKGLTKALADINTKIQTGINTQGGPADATITDAEYKAVGTALTAIEESINKALESDDLTQLDTANLKAIRSSVLDIKNTFENISEITKNGNDYKVGKDDLEKVSKVLENISKAREEVGASATKALASSKV